MLYDNSAQPIWFKTVVGYQSKLTALEWMRAAIPNGRQQKMVVKME